MKTNTKDQNKNSDLPKDKNIDVSIIPNRPEEKTEDNIDYYKNKIQDSSSHSKND